MTRCVSFVCWCVRVSVWNRHLHRHSRLVKSIWLWKLKYNVDTNAIITWVERDEIMSSMFYCFLGPLTMSRSYCQCSFSPVTSLLRNLLYWWWWSMWRENITRECSQSDVVAFTLPHTLPWPQRVCPHLYDCVSFYWSNTTFFFLSNPFLFKLVAGCRLFRETEREWLDIDDQVGKGRRSNSKLYSKSKFISVGLLKSNCGLRGRKETGEWDNHYHKMVVVMAPIYTKVSINNKALVFIFSSIFF